jgi:predicted MPP superfamily phosphohydrolase
VIPPLVAVAPGAPRLAARHVAATLLFVLWLEAGYTAGLVGLAHLPWPTALWQAALCIAAVPPLLLIVVQAISLPKLVHGRVSRWGIEALWLSGNAAEFGLPWLGWATLLWALGDGAWSRALPPAAGIALFSYLTGAALLLVFAPRPRDVQTTRLELPVPQLPAAFDGYTVLHVSDMHAGWMLPPPRARARLRAAEVLKADLVVFTGDLASEARCVAGAAEVVGALRGRDGVLAVPGNHDNWMGRRRVQAELAKHGVRMLVNECVTVRRGGAAICVAGVDNAAYARRDDLTAALREAPDGAPVVLLSHAPGIVTRPACARAGLVLSGHTHGGQIVLPLLGPVHVTSDLGLRYASGLFRRGDGWLYINRGLGEIFPPLRLLCPPEVALITLRVPTN